MSEIDLSTSVIESLDQLVTNMLDLGSTPSPECTTEERVEELFEADIFNQAEEIESTLRPKEKKAFKKLFIDKLGYKANYQFKCAISRICDNYAYFKSEGLTHADIGKIIKKSPKAMKYGTGLTKKRVNFIKNIGVAQKNIPRILIDSPQIISYPIKSMQEKVDALLSEGIAEEAIASMTVLRPGWISLNLKLITDHIRYFRSWDLKDEEVANIITKCPRVFEYSIDDNLTPKHKFLTKKLGCSSQDIARYPTLLTYSLELRLQPRYEFFKNKNLLDTFTPATICTSSDDSVIDRILNTKGDYRSLRHRRARLREKGTVQQLAAVQEKIKVMKEKEKSEYHDFMLSYFSLLVEKKIQEKEYKRALEVCRYGKKHATADEKQFFDDKREQINKLKLLLPSDRNI